MRKGGTKCMVLVPEMSAHVHKKESPRLTEGFALWFFVAALLPRLARFLQKLRQRARRVQRE